jgi:arsenate reductase-like glutaredoxin family protein
LRKAGHELTEINFAKASLDEATVKDLVARAGSVAAVLNTRHAIAKDKGWAARPPDAATFAKAVAKEPNLLRRPILVAGKQLIVGFDKAAYAKLESQGSGSAGPRSAAARPRAGE